MAKQASATEQVPEAEQISDIERVDETGGLKGTLERLCFSFNAETWKDDADRLEGILTSGAWGYKWVDYADDYTQLLVGLLLNGGIALYERVYPLKREHTDETEARARELCDVLHRNHCGAAYDIADLFPRELAYSRTLHNAPYFPDLKAHIRVGNLPVEWLFEMLEQSYCEVIILFDGCQYTNTEGRHYFIQRAMPCEALTQELDVVREKRQNQAFEMIRQCSDISEQIIPKVPKVTDFDE